MSSHGDDDVLKADRSGHDRLRMICQVHDADTRDLLTRAGVEVEHVAVRHPHYVTGEEKGLWSWTCAEAGQSLIKAGLLDAERDAQWRAGMTAADEDPGTLVARARTHQVIARKVA